MIKFTHTCKPATGDQIRKALGISDKIYNEVKKEIERLGTKYYKEMRGIKYK